MENTKKLFVSCFKSRKGAVVLALILDLGYTKKFLSFDRATISECLGCSIADTYDIPEGKDITILGVK